MSEYFYIFLDFALVFGGLVLLLIGVFYVGWYLVLRWAGERFFKSFDKRFDENSQQRGQPQRWRLRKDAHRQVKND